MCNNWGYAVLEKVAYDEAIEEMKHADLVIQRILFLEGVPNLADYDRILVGPTPREQFQSDLELERAALAVLRPGVALCLEIGDHATRDLPERIHVGGDGRVDLTVVNESSQTTPTVSFTDDFDGGERSARFLLPPLTAHGTARAAYRIPTDTRGRHELGPLSASIGDPFGTLTRWFPVSGQLMTRLSEGTSATAMVRPKATARIISSNRCESEWGYRSTQPQWVF